MSMHEFEDLVESSIIILSKSKKAEEMDLRSVFYNLYGFQAWFDTGYTHFRLIDELLKHNFVYRLPLSEFPKYKKYKSYFETIKKNKKSTFINKIPNKEWGSKNPDIGYYDADSSFLYCDAGSILWKMWVREGKLKDKDSISPKKIALTKIAKDICVESEKQISDDPENALYTIYMWFLLYPYIFSKNENINFQKIKNKASVKQIRAIAIRTKAYELEKEYEYTNDAYCPTLEDMEEYEIDEFFEGMFDELGIYDDSKSSLKFLKWWYKPLKLNNDSK